MMWSGLPEELWKLILVHVPLPERLGTCSRVSQKLCRAAAAATEQLEVQLQRSAQRSQGVVQWLHHNGQHVTSIQLRNFNASLTELPCLQLRKLAVDGGSVQLGPSSSHPGVLHSCSGLTKLRLWGCIVVDGCRSLAALSAVPALQHLHLCVTAATAFKHRLELPGSILQVLTQLTLLELEEIVGVTADTLQHISALQQLQVLSLTPPSSVPRRQSSVPLSPSSTPGLTQLTGLHTLKVSRVSLDPAVLQQHTQLRHLELAQADFDRCCKWCCVAGSNWPTAAAGAAGACQSF